MAFITKYPKKHLKYTVWLCLIECYPIAEIQIPSFLWYPNVIKDKWKTAREAMRQLSPSMRMNLLLSQGKNIIQAMTWAGPDYTRWIYISHSRDIQTFNRCYDQNRSTNQQQDNLKEQRQSSASRLEVISKLRSKQVPHSSFLTETETQKCWSNP